MSALCAPDKGSLSAIPGHHPVGLVVKVAILRAEDLGSIPAISLGDFSGLSHTSNLKIGTPVAALPGVQRYRVGAGTCWPGVSMPWLGEVERLICNLHLSVTACSVV